MDRPEDETGKNRSGSADRQPAEERQSWSTSPGIGGWQVTWVERRRTASRPHHQDRQVSRPLHAPPHLVVRFDDVPRRGPVNPRRMSGSAENVYDVIVIGAGPVGYTPADRVRAAGLSVAAVERELVGGECSYWACIPSKAMLRPVCTRDGVAIPGLSGRPNRYTAVQADPSVIEL